MKMMKRNKVLLSVLVLILFIGGIIYFYGGYNSVSNELPKNIINNSAQEKVVNNTKIEDRRQDQIVLIQEYKFSPSELSINKGEKVTWINMGKNTHYVLSIKGVRVIDSKNMAPGQNYTVAFNVEPGTYEYFDPIYKADMFGKIIVK